MEKKNITLAELVEKEQELVNKYNEYTQKGWHTFAENAITNLEAVRYVQALIEMKYKEEAK